MTKTGDNNSGYKSDLSIDEKILMATVRTAEFFRREHSAIFRNFGLTFSQYNVLRVLDASEDGQNTITNISKIMLVAGANMTGIAKRLERNGFVLRKAALRDERVTLVEIMPKGRQTLKNISKAKDERLKRVMIDFSENDKILILTNFRKLLKKMISLQ